MVVIEAVPSPCWWIWLLWQLGHCDKVDGIRKRRRRGPRSRCPIDAKYYGKKRTRPP